MKYCIVALPRSKTAWLAHWLGVPHEPLSQMRDFSQMPEGCVDTGVTVFLPAILKRWPDAKYLFVHRAVSEIAESSEKIGLPTENLAHLRSKWEYAWAHRPRHSLRVNFEELSDIDVLRQVWTFLREDSFDELRTALLLHCNIQANTKEVLAGIDWQQTRRFMDEAGLHMEV